MVERYRYSYGDNNKQLGRIKVTYRLISCHHPNFLLLKSCSALSNRHDFRNFHAFHHKFAAITYRVHSLYDVVAEYFKKMGFTLSVLDIASVVHLQTYELDSVEGHNSFTFNHRYFLPKHFVEFQTAGLAYSSFYNSSVPACEMKVQFLNMTKGKAAVYFLVVAICSAYTYINYRDWHLLFCTRTFTDRSCLIIDISLRRLINMCARYVPSLNA